MSPKITFEKVPTQYQQLLIQSQPPLTTSHPPLDNLQIEDIFNQAQHIVKTSQLSMCSWNVIYTNSFQNHCQLISLLEHFKPPTITKYTRSSDPEAHLKYTTLMLLYAHNDPLLCMYFPTTLASHVLD